MLFGGSRFSAYFCDVFLPRKVSGAYFLLSCGRCLRGLTLVDTDTEWSGDFVGECYFVDGVYEGFQWLSMGELGPAEN